MAYQMGVGISRRTGFDCSGQTQSRALGPARQAPRTAQPQYNATIRATWRGVRPGDPVFFYSGRTVYDVGIYAGSRYVDAPHTGARCGWKRSEVNTSPSAGSADPTNPLVSRVGPTGPGYRYDEIVTVARQLLASPEALSLRAIAAAMGLTAPALYRYVDIYHELLMLVARAVFEDVISAMCVARDR